MSLDSGDDLDLTAFLQDDDVGSFLGHDTASGSGPALNNELALSNVSLPEASTSSNPTQRQRQERRGHTKSRRGCYNCKRRRIKYEYLMHAVLGLAASDLMTQDPSLVTFAMMHRLKAINAIKRSLSEAPKMDTFEEGNALMATCFALTFQSIVLDDGMAEFMTFCRGIALVSMQMYSKGVKFLFSNLQHLDTSEVLKPHMDAMPLVRRDWVDMAVAAIRGLEPLCTQPVEIEYYTIILEIAEALYTDSYLALTPRSPPSQAYRTLSRHYGWWMQIPHEQFQYLIDTARQTCTLLASHWIALKQVMAPVTEIEYSLRARQPEEPGAAAAASGGGGGGGGGIDKSNNNKNNGDMDLGMVRWLRHLNRQVDAAHLHYNGWPVWVEDQLNRNVRAFGKTEPRI
ncbi:hypothetical protein Hte_003362 [Hypoxylon texense]